MALANPKTKAAIKAEKNPDIVAPGIINAVMIMASVAMSQVESNSIILILLIISLRYLSLLQITAAYISNV